MVAGKALILLALAVPAGVIGWMQGCGPSVQSVYEGNVRFEHCYRLDLDPNIAAGHREACWRSYAEQYHYGQTQDRVEYARRRVRALSAGDTSRPTLTLDAGDAEAISPSEAPTPTSMHAPPPPTAKKTPTDAGADGPAPPVPTVASKDGGMIPPEARCTAACWSTWQKCGGPNCNVDAGGKVGKACALCDKDYRRCMQRCFR